MSDKRSPRSTVVGALTSERRGRSVPFHARTGCAIARHPSGAADDREILFDLDMARRALFEQHGKTREFDLIAKSYANLLRKWSEV